MSNPHFSLNINLGNETMNSVEEVAGALQAIVDRLESDPYDQVGYIEDRDGHTVGSYLFDWDGNY